jgi:hypothetical protein
MKYQYRVLVGRPEGKRLLGVRRCKWEDNIKMTLKEIRYAVLDLILQTQRLGQVEGCILI